MLLKKIFEKLAEVFTVKSGPASQYNSNNGINLQDMNNNDTVKLLVEVLSSDYDKMLSKGARGKLFATSPEGVGYLAGFIDGFMQGLDPHCLAPYTRPLIFGFSNKVSGAGGRMFNA
jgi:hypothetical protein